MWELVLELGSKGGWVAAGDVLSLPAGSQPQITPDELEKADKAVRSDPEVCRLAEEVGIKPDQIHADGWSIGYDNRFDPSLRLHSCLLFARLSENDNLYAHPSECADVCPSLV